MAAQIGTPGAIQSPPASAGVYGQGIKYPLAIDATTGRLALSWGPTSVDDSIRSICMTAQGERVMLPSYGAGGLTFEPVDENRISFLVQSQIESHEPRARNPQVRLSIAPNQVVIVAVTYQLLSDANPHTLTFPLFTPTPVTAASQ